MKGCRRRRRLDETRPVQRSHALAEMSLAGGEQQDGSQQREGEAETAQHQELPARLERRVLVVECDEKHRRQRRQLDGNPHDAEVVRHRDEEHREHVGGNQAVELAAHARGHQVTGFVAPQVPHAVGARHQTDEATEDQHQGRQPVDAQRVAEGRRDRAAKKLASRRDAQPERRQEAADHDGLLELARPGHSLQWRPSPEEHRASRRAGSRASLSAWKAGSRPSTRTDPRCDGRGRRARGRPRSRRTRCPSSTTSGMPGVTPTATRNTAFSTVSSARICVIAFLRVTIRNSPINSIDSATPMR